MGKWWREPSIFTTTEIAKIFEVSIDIIHGVSARLKLGVVVEKEYVYEEVPKQVLVICETCNKPIYDGKEIVLVLYYICLDILLRFTKM